MIFGFIETPVVVIGGVLVIGALLTFTLLPVALGFAALRRIDRDPEVYRGRRLAVGAIIMGVLGFFMLIAIGLFGLFVAARPSASMATRSARIATPSIVSAPSVVSITPTPVAPSAAVASGKILSTRPDLKIVMLSIGSQQGVAKGNQFTIKRNGQYINRVQVDKVYPDMSGARYLDENGKDVEVDDEVLLLTPDLNAEAPMSTTPAPNKQKTPAEDF
jgi:hypothetical protein